MKWTATAAAVAFATTGCATFRENPVACTATATVIGAALGGVGGGVGVDQIEPTPDDGEIAAGAAAGLVAGGVAGYVIAHYLCPKPEPVVAPRPPEPVRTPPPPPPTERRGG